MSRISRGHNAQTCFGLVRRLHARVERVFLVPRANRRLDCGFD